MSRRGVQQLENGDLLIRASETDGEVTGMYTCVARNELGEDRVESFLYATPVSVRSVLRARGGAFHVAHARAPV